MVHSFWVKVSKSSLGKGGGGGQNDKLWVGGHNVYLSFLSSKILKNQKDKKTQKTQKTIRFTFCGGRREGGGYL